MKSADEKVKNVAVNRRAVQAVSTTPTPTTSPFASDFSLPVSAIGVVRLLAVVTGAVFAPLASPAAGLQMLRALVALRVVNVVNLDSSGQTYSSDTAGITTAENTTQEEFCRRTVWALSPSLASPSDTTASRKINSDLFDAAVGSGAAAPFRALAIINASLMAAVWIVFITATIVVSRCVVRPRRSSIRSTPSPSSGDNANVQGLSDPSPLSLPRRRSSGQHHRHSNRGASDKEDHGDADALAAPLLADSASPHTLNTDQHQQCGHINGNHGDQFDGSGPQPSSPNSGREGGGSDVIRRLQKAAAHVRFPSAPAVLSLLFLDATIANVAGLVRFGWLAPEFASVPSECSDFWRDRYLDGVIASVSAAVAFVSIFAAIWAAVQTLRIAESRLAAYSIDDVPTSRLAQVWARTEIWSPLVPTLADLEAHRTPPRPGTSANAAAASTGNTNGAGFVTHQQSSQRQRPRGGPNAHGNDDHDDENGERPQRVRSHELFRSDEPDGDVHRDHSRKGSYNNNGHADHHRRPDERTGDGDRHHAPRHENHHHQHHTNGTGAEDEEVDIEHRCISDQDEDSDVPPPPAGAPPPPSHPPPNADREEQRQRMLMEHKEKYAPPPPPPPAAPPAAAAHRAVVNPLSSFHKTTTSSQSNPTNPLAHTGGSSSHQRVASNQNQNPNQNPNQHAESRNHQVASTSHHGAPEQGAAPDTSNYQQYRSKDLQRLALTKVVDGRTDVMAVSRRSPRTATGGSVVAGTGARSMVTGDEAALSSPRTLKEADSKADDQDEIRRRVDELFGAAPLAAPGDRSASDDEQFCNPDLSRQSRQSGRSGSRRKAKAQGRESGRGDKASRGANDRTRQSSTDLLGSSSTSLTSTVDLDFEDDLSDANPTAPPPPPPRPTSTPPPPTARGTAHQQHQTSNQPAGLQSGTKHTKSGDTTANRHQQQSPVVPLSDEDVKDLLPHHKALSPQHRAFASDSVPPPLSPPSAAGATPAERAEHWAAGERSKRDCISPTSPSQVTNPAGTQPATMNVYAPPSLENAAIAAGHHHHHHHHNHHHENGAPPARTGQVSTRVGGAGGAGGTHEAVGYDSQGRGGPALARRGSSRTLQSQRQDSVITRPIDLIPRYITNAMVTFTRNGWVCRMYRHNGRLFFLGEVFATLTLAALSGAHATSYDQAAAMLVGVAIIQVAMLVAGATLQPYALPYQNIAFCITTLLSSVSALAAALGSANETDSGIWAAEWTAIGAVAVVLITSTVAAARNVTESQQQSALPSSYDTSARGDDADATATMPFHSSSNGRGMTSGDGGDFRSGDDVRGRGDRIHHGEYRRGGQRDRVRVDGIDDDDDDDDGGPRHHAVDLQHQSLAPGQQGFTSSRSDMMRLTPGTLATGFFRVPFAVAPRGGDSASRNFAVAGHHVPTSSQSSDLRYLSRHTHGNGPAGASAGGGGDGFDSANVRSYGGDPFNPMMSTTSASRQPNAHAGTLSYRGGGDAHNNGGGPVNGGGGGGHRSGGAYVRGARARHLLQSPHSHGVDMQRRGPAPATAAMDGRGDERQHYRYDTTTNEHHNHHNGHPNAHRDQFAPRHHHDGLHGGDGHDRDLHDDAFMFGGSGGAGGVGGVGGAAVGLSPPFQGQLQDDDDDEYNDEALLHAMVPAARPRHRPMHRVVGSSSMHQPSHDHDHNGGGGIDDGLHDLHHHAVMPNEDGFGADEDLRPSYNATAVRPTSATRQHAQQQRQGSSYGHQNDATTGQRNSARVRTSSQVHHQGGHNDSRVDGPGPADYIVDGEDEEDDLLSPPVVTLHAEALQRHNARPAISFTTAAAWTPATPQAGFSTSAADRHGRERGMQRQRDREAAATAEATEEEDAADRGQQQSSAAGGVVNLSFNSASPSMKALAAQSAVAMGAAAHVGPWVLEQQMFHDKRKRAAARARRLRQEEEERARLQQISNRSQSQAHSIRSQSSQPPVMEATGRTASSQLLQGGSATQRSNNGADGGSHRQDLRIVDDSEELDSPLRASATRRRDFNAPGVAPVAAAVSASAPRNTAPGVRSIQDQELDRQREREKEKAREQNRQAQLLQAQLSRRPPDLSFPSFKQNAVQAATTPTPTPTTPAPAAAPAASRNKRPSPDPAGVARGSTSVPRRRTAPAEAKAVKDPKGKVSLRSVVDAAGAGSEEHRLLRAIEDSESDPHAGETPVQNPLSQTTSAHTMRDPRSAAGGPPSGYDGTHSSGRFVGAAGSGGHGMGYNHGVGLPGLQMDERSPLSPLSPLLPHEQPRHQRPPPPVGVSADAFRRRPAPAWGPQPSASPPPPPGGQGFGAGRRPAAACDDDFEDDIGPPEDEDSSSAPLDPDEFDTDLLV